MSTPKQPAVMRADDWQNVYTALGTSKDKRKGTLMCPPPSWERSELMDLYRGSDLVATLIDLPADDMTREGFEVTVEEDPENEANAAVMDYLDGADDGEDQGLNATKALHDGLRWSALFGGAAIVMGINDGQSPDKPVNYDAIKSVDFLNVLDRYSIRPWTYYADPLAPKFGQPELYRISFYQSAGTGVANATAQVAFRLVHESRVIYMDGVDLPYQDRIRNQGAGDSVVTRVWEVVQDYASVWMSFAYLLQDYAHTTLKIKGLRDAISAPDGKAIVQARMEAIEMCRSVARMVLLDEGEEFGREVVSLAGMHEAMQKFIERLAQAARMPIELLMGQPPGGINGNGETGMRYWHALIKAMQKRKLQPALHRLLRVVFLAKNGPTDGKLPEKWEVCFNPLMAPTDAEKADIYSKMATADAAYVTNEIVDRTEIANSRFGSGRYSMETKLDPTVRKFIDQNALEDLKNPPDPVDPNAAKQAPPPKDKGNG